MTGMARYTELNDRIAVNIMKLGLSGLTSSDRFNSHSRVLRFARFDGPLTDSPYGESCSYPNSFGRCWKRERRLSCMNT